MWRLYKDTPDSEGLYNPTEGTVWQVSPDGEDCWYKDSADRRSRAYADREFFDNSKHFVLIDESCCPFFLVPGDAAFERANSVEHSDSDDWTRILDTDEDVENFWSEFDEDDPFRKILLEIEELNRRKRGDYATNADPFSNFKDSARQINVVPGFAAEILIGTKQSRLRQLLNRDSAPNNESIRDSLLDRAVYSMIALAMWDAGLYDDDSEAANAT